MMLEKVHVDHHWDDLEWVKILLMIDAGFYSLGQKIKRRANTEVKGGLIGV